MDNKHFIWIVPMLLIVGFIIGFISGIKIPKEITLRIDDRTLAVIEKQQSIELINKNNSLPSCSNPIYVNPLSNKSDGGVYCNIDDWEVKE